jgi:VWFA-related protein
MTRNCRSLLVVAVVLVSFIAPAFGIIQQANNPDQSVIRIGADLVQIDVSVIDKNNKPVTGLTKDDFEVYDDGGRQVVTHFSYQASGSGSAMAGSEEPSSLTNSLTAGEVKRVLAFVVDTLHIKQENLSRTQQMLGDFIDNKMQPGDLVLILPTAGGSGLVQQFTADHRILHRAVDSLRIFAFSTDTTPHRSSGASATSTSITNGPAVPSTAGMGASPGSNPGAGMGAGRGGGRRGGGASTNPGKGMTRPKTPMDNVDPVEEADVRATLFSLDDLIRAMRKLPGRKIGVFVSEGLRIVQTETNEDLRLTTDLAARSGVVFYTIDPRGLDTLSVDAVDDASGQSSTVEDFRSQKISDYMESQDSLNALALDTGGKFFHDNNDIKAGLTAVLEQNPGYYLLGFQPDPSKWDGKYHKLKVAVRGRSDVTVSARAGYLARDEKPAASMAGVDPKVVERIEAINSPLIHRDIDLQLTPFYKDGAKQDAVMVTLLHVDASQLHFKQVEGRYQDKLEVSGFVFDTLGKPVDTFTDVLDLNLLPKTYEETLKGGIISTRTLSVKPGLYQMRVLVEEPETKKLGTANNFVDVPDLKSDRLAMSSIFTLAGPEGQGTVAGSENQAGTLSQRRFKRGSMLNYMFVIYNAEGEGSDHHPQLEMRTRILKGLKVIFPGPAIPVQALQGSTPPKRIVTGAALSVGSALTAGDYVLEVTVTDKLAKKEKRSVTKQEIDFTVE